MIRLRLIRWLARMLAKRGRAWALVGPHGPYLVRYVLAGQSPAKDSKPARSFYLHNLCSPDPDVGLTHRHPALLSFGFCLNSGYTERRQERIWEPAFTREIRAGSFNWLSAHTYHEIVDVRPDTWTLFYMGKDDRGDSWGFNVPGRGYVQWQQARDEGLISVADWVNVDENGSTVN